MSETVQPGALAPIVDDLYFPRIRGRARHPGPALYLTVGTRLNIDGVECIITGIDHKGIATRPVTDAD